jgi:hypothetical protein
MRPLLLAALSASLVGADPPDTRYILAQPSNIASYTPAALVIDADFTVIPVLLEPHGADAVRRLENMRKCRQAILADLMKDNVYQLSPIGLAEIPGPPATQQAGVAEQGGVFSPTAPGATPEPLVGYLVVKSGAVDPEKTEIEVRNRLAPFDGEPCHLRILSRHLAVLDPERFRRDLLIRFEKYVELSRIAAPKGSRARVDGLELGLTATETVDGRHVLIGLPCQLRVEESN